MNVHGAKDAGAIGVVLQTSERLDCGIAILCYPREQRARPPSTLQLFGQNLPTNMRRRPPSTLRLRKALFL